MARQAIAAASRAGRPVYVCETGNREAIALGPFVNETISGIVITPTVRALNISGLPPVITIILASKTITPSVGAVAIAGQPPTVTRTTIAFFAPAPRALAIAASAPTVTTAQATPAKRSGIIRGRLNPTFLQQTGLRQVITGAPVFVIDTIVGAPVTQPSAGTATITGQRPVLSFATPIVPSLATQMALTQLAARFTVGFVYSPSSGTLTITGQAPIVSASQSVQPGTGALTITRSVPVVTTAPFSQPAAGTLGITGQPPIVTPTFNAYGQPAARSLLIQGEISGVAIEPGGPYSMAPTHGDVAIVGEAPDTSISNNYFVPTTVSPDLAITGEAPDVSITTPDYSVTPDVSPDLIIAGEQPDVSQTGVLFISPSAGSVTITGRRPIVSVRSNLPVGPGGAALIRAAGTVTSIRAITGVSGIQAIAFDTTQGA